MAETDLVRMPVALGTQEVFGEHVSPRRAAVRRFLRYRLAIVGVVMRWTARSRLTRPRSRTNVPRT